MPVADTAPAPAIDRGTYGRLAGRARPLSWASLAYMALEGGVAIGGRRAPRAEAGRRPVLHPRALRGRRVGPALVQGERPGVSWLGVALSASSLVVMPYLGVAKQRIADRIGSAATRGEGRQNLLRAALAGALLLGLLGLLGNALAGAWWLDPLVGLLIAVIAVREGVEAWQGEGCACAGTPSPAG